MYGFDPIGSLPYAGLNVSMPIDVAQTLSMAQVVTCDDIKNIVQTLTITPTNEYKSDNNIPQSLTFIQTPVFGHVNIVPVNQSIVIGQSDSVTRSNNIAQLDTLSIGHIVVAKTPGDLANSVLLVQTNSLIQSRSCIVSDLMAISQSLTYAHNVPQNLSQSLTIGQSVVYNKDAQAAQTLTLTQTIVAQIPIHVSVNQTLIITHSTLPIFFLIQAQSLTFVQNAVPLYTAKHTQHDTLSFLQVIDVAPVMNPRHVLSIVQTLQTALSTATSQSITITHGVIFVDLQHLFQTIAVIPTLSTITKYNTPIVQVLSLVQTPQPMMGYNIDTVQTISPKQIGSLNYINYYMFCQCVDIIQQVANYIPVSVNQNITFTWTEKDVQYQTLLISQFIETNYDDISCCNPNGANSDGDGGGNIHIAQAIGCAMTYNVAITQSLSLLTASAWRP